MLCFNSMKPGLGEMYSPIKRFFHRNLSYITITGVFFYQVLKLNLRFFITLQGDKKTSLYKVIKKASLYKVIEKVSLYRSIK